MGHLTTTMLSALNKAPGATGSSAVAATLVRRPTADSNAACQARLGSRLAWLMATPLLVTVLLLSWLLAAAPARAAFPGTNGKIAFASDRDGNDEVYVMNADGSGPINLTNNAASDLEPAFSPDGTQIAFTSTRDGTDEVYVMNANGTGQTRLTNNAAFDGQPAFSPDGTKIAFTSDRDGNVEVFVMNADGSGPINLTNNAAFDAEPGFSPDGTQIAFTSERDGNNEVYVMNASGTGQTRLTNNAASDGPAFSPDGTKIAFTSFRDGNNEVSVMNTDGTDQTNRTNNAASDGQPAFSPDGTQIAFTSNRDGNNEVYVMNADGSGQTNRTNNTAKDLQPDWGRLVAAPAPPPTPPLTPPLALPPFAAKLEIARAGVLRSARRLSVLAPITGRASGEVAAEFFAAGRKERFETSVDAENRRVRINRRIPLAQARLGTGILTLTYPGDEDTQPQEVRLRAASRKARLLADRPKINANRLTAKGRISSLARGVVRLQLLYEPAGQDTVTLEFTAPISNGRYEFDERLPDIVVAGIASRRGVVHSYTLFTGYFQRRVRGEMRSYQIMGAP